MSYNDKLAQTGKRVANARREYYGSFDYGSGIDAKLRGGSFSFGKKFWGGGNTWYGGKDADKFKEKFLDGAEQSESGIKWSGLLGTGAEFINDIVAGSKGMTDNYNSLMNASSLYTNNAYNGVSDNSGLIAALQNAPVMSDVYSSDIRNRTIGQDVGSALTTGLGAGLSTSNFLIGLGATALDFGKSLFQRMTAQDYADRVNEQTRQKNLRLNQEAFNAGERVDANNDWMRMMNYYMYPYDYAFGGLLHSHGGDYNGGLTYIDEGGRHEENPYEGVPSGFDEEGNPNLVEEGEVIWNNEYVFSDRLKVPKELVAKYKLGGKKDYTFAEAIEKVTKENKISPTDAITIATTKEIVNEFMEAQEALRQQEQIAAREELEAAQAQDFLAQLEAAQGGGYPMGAPVDMGNAGMGMPNEAPVTEGEMMPPGFAFGGNKFDGGGWEDFFKMLEEYRGSLGASNLAGRYAIDKNSKYWNNRTAEQVEAEESYGKFTKWVKEHSDNPNVQKYFEYLDKGINKSKGAKTLLKYDKDGKVTGLADDWETTFNKRRTDKALGIYHLSPMSLGFLTKPSEVTVPDVKLKDFDYNTPFDVDAYLNSDTTEASKDEGNVNVTTSSSPQFNYRDTYLRYAPAIGSSMAALYGMLNRPDYSNADRVIDAAYRMGTPVNIPVETIGDYRRRNPYDERYLVNMANQNRLAAARGIANTAGGNRAMDLLGNMNLAHNNQQELGEIMRQAYLANRQDDAQVAEFNRGTNVYNMNALNQRNLSQAQLNSHRQQASLSGLAQGYGMRQAIKDNWDAATMQSLNSTLASLGAIGKENEEYNMLMSMAENGYFPHYYGDRSIIKFNPYTGEKLVKNGGKLNRKKRRF